jgi:hypothetical protein
MFSAILSQKGNDDVSSNNNSPQETSYKILQEKGLTTTGESIRKSNVKSLLTKKESLEQLESYYARELQCHVLNVLHDLKSEVNAVGLLNNDQCAIGLLKIIKKHTRLRMVDMADFLDEDDIELDGYEDNS